MILSLCSYNHWVYKYVLCCDFFLLIHVLIKWYVFLNRSFAHIVKSVTLNVYISGGNYRYQTEL
jgi:hypothetical protein